MIPVKYAYLTGALLFTAIWAILFWHRRDLRQPMLVMGSIFSVASFLTGYYWTIDWWRPLTITGTRVGFEDLLFGFTIGGIATVLYIELLHKRYTRAKSGEHAKKLLLLTAASYGLFLLFFYQLRLGSAMSCFISTAVYSAVIVYLRRDLFFSAIINGLLTLLVSVPVYFLYKLLCPTAISQEWIFPLHPNFRVFDVPAQEFIFYFAFGFMVPLVYEYWHGLTIKRAPAFKKTSRRAQPALKRIVKNI
jgi:hypothetical protein